jgi:small subunit ribosomal protein S19
MSRSIWKGPYIDKDLYKQIIASETKTIYTQSRNSTIIPQCLNRIFYVYNGLSYYKIQINENMIGHKLGEFILTKKRVIFKKKKKKKKT